jgi:hypothetical protein
VSHWIPNTNPDLVGVFDDGDLLVPIVCWPQTCPPYLGYLGRTVTGQLATVVLDRATGQVVSVAKVWESLTHYRDDNG